MTAASITPRPLTAAVRERIGIPTAARGRYRWDFALLVVGLACVPLFFAALFAACFGVAAIGFVVLPAVRWFEARDARWREEVYRFGEEARGRVLEIEPAGEGRADHIVRLEFPAPGGIVRTSVFGCPLARRGLAPDDEVVVLYARDRPSRCLIFGKVDREIVDAIFDE